MIKINLLAEGKRPAAVRKVSAGGGSFLEREGMAQWLLLAAVVLALLVAGGLWYKANRDLTAKKAEVAAAQKEVEKLKAILDEVKEFEQKKAELEHKIAVINELKANQRGPVRMMDTISQALPELLWLDKMVMAPNRVTLNGRAFNINAVSNFIENLDRVPEFREPSLRDISQQGRVFNFAITFTYTYAPPATSDDAVESVDNPVGG
jgi:type IV pilus assembly protein PilN